MNGCRLSPTADTPHQQPFFAVTPGLARDLRSLSLEGCSHVSDTGVAELAKLCTSLTYLNISNCERVGEYGDRALLQLGRSCHKLKGLDAFGCSHAQV